MSISKNAKEFLEDLDFYQVPVRPKEICRKLDITYDERPYSGFDGLLLVGDDKQLIGVSSKIEEESRKTFTCAHELGHYYYDLPKNGLIKCNKNDLGYGKHDLDEKEKRANQFASELLLPGSFFLNDIGNKEPSWELFQDLSRKYETSLQVTVSRYVALSPFTCWLIIGKGGKLQRFVKADHNEFFVDLNSSYRAPRAAHSDWIAVSADNWLYASRRTSTKELLLWPLPENRYGESLMLLWDENDSLHHNTEYEDDDSWNFQSFKRY